MQQITEYQYINKICSDISFHHCLASKLRSSQNCSHLSEPCSLYNLPTEEPLKDMPSCASTEATECYKNVLEKYYYDKHTCKKPEEKACQIKEYTPEEITPPISPQGLEGYGYGFYNVYKPPKSTRGERTAELLKTLMTQEYTWTTARCVGTIGGSLGLMIGFSFMEIGNWVTDCCFQLFGMSLKRMLWE